MFVLAPPGVHRGDRPGGTPELIQKEPTMFNVLLTQVVLWVGARIQTFMLTLLAVNTGWF